MPDRSVSRYAWTDLYERLSAADSGTPAPARRSSSSSRPPRIASAKTTRRLPSGRARIQEFITRGQQERATRSAFWLAFGLLHKGERARGCWLGRPGAARGAGAAQHGRVLIRMGETAAGVMLLDEAMAAVDAGEVSPSASGHVYCSVIEGCLEIFHRHVTRLAAFGLTLIATGATVATAATEGPGAAVFPMVLVALTAVVAHGRRYGARTITVGTIRAS